MLVSVVDGINGVEGSRRVDVLFGEGDEFLAECPAVAVDVVAKLTAEKDVLSLSSHGFNAICLNSETAKVPDDLLTSLRGRFNNIVILYDTDETGRREAAARVCEIERLGYCNVHRVILPLKGTKEEKDISDFFRLGHNSKELSKLTESVIYGGRELYSGIHR